MKKHLLVVGIIFLFIGAGAVPATCTIYENEGIIEKQIEVESEPQNNAISQDVDWWPMYLHDPQHSGYSTAIVPDTLDLLWTFETSRETYAGPTVVDGRVYWGTRTYKYYCLNMTDGSEIWSYDADSDIAYLGFYHFRLTFTI